MKNRLPWLIAGTLALAGIVVFQVISRPSRPAAALPPEAPTAQPQAQTTAAPIVAIPVAPTTPAVAARLDPNVIDITTIRDGTTIDLSSGRPVVTQSKADREIMDSALKEMEAAARGVTFSGTSTVPEKAKK